MNAANRADDTRNVSANAPLPLSNSWMRSMLVLRRARIPERTGSLLVERILRCVSRDRPCARIVELFSKAILRPSLIGGSPRLVGGFSAQRRHRESTRHAPARDRPP